MQGVVLLAFELSLLIEVGCEGGQLFVALTVVLCGTEEVDDDEFVMQVVLDD